jgi:hypothetical protein
VRLQVLAPGHHPDFLDLPWDQPVEEWTTPRLHGRPGGLHRHIVRYVAYDAAVYVCKELPPRLAEREYTLLRHLALQSIPVVEVVGLAADRGRDLEDVLITRHLDFSLPYRVLLGDRHLPYLTERLLDALAGLLVRLHLSGFFWGDCSLSNTLFRRDAGALTAYVVDVETGELHPSLTDGQRSIDLEIAVENIAGGLADLQAAGRLDADLDIADIADHLRTAYGKLWFEVTRTDTFASDESYRIDARIRRLNDLGFDVAEIELTQSGGGGRLLLTPRVVELGYFSPKLFALTGLQTGENQARRLLNDIREFGLRVGRQVPEGVVAARWLDQRFEPTIAAIPASQRGKLEPAELYHQVLEHRWYRSEQEGRDIGNEEAITSYVREVLRPAPDEHLVLEPADPDEE